MSRQIGNHWAGFSRKITIPNIIYKLVILATSLVIFHDLYNLYKSNFESNFLPDKMCYNQA